MRWLTKYIAHLFGQNADPEVHYQGDVQDTPPAIIRLAMSAACTFGATMMFYDLFTTQQHVALIVGCGMFLIALFLIWIVPRASQTTMVTALFWGLVGVMVLFLPFK